MEEADRYYAQSYAEYEQLGALWYMAYLLERRAEIYLEYGWRTEALNLATARYPFQQEVIHAPTVRAYDNAPLDW